MKPIPLLPALAFLAAVLPAAAPAQSFSDPGLGVGAHAGIADGASAGSASFAGGLHLRYRFSASLGLEGAVGYRSETVDDGSGPLLGLVEIPFTGTGQLFFFPRTRVQPFLLAGAGLHVVKTTPKGRNTGIGGGTEAQFAMHAGAGLDVRPSRTSAVTLDARWVFLQTTAVTDLADAGYDVKSGYLSVALGFTLFR
ncbi:MAG: outer membrane beta-barrel protein [Thermoanaerobaculia bacterium]